NHLNWSRIAEELGGEVTLLAPDLRGRGGSAALPGPYGMGAHADDMIAVLDHFGIGRALFAGHSMGAFVMAIASARRPERTTGVLLIDGGFKLGEVPEGVDIDVILQAVIGPALERLKTTFPSREAYRDFWRAHPALAGDWSEHLEAYVDYDLTGEEPELRSRTSLEAVREDGRTSLLESEIDTAPGRLPEPALFLRAPLGMLGAEPPLYPDEAVEAIRAQSPQLQVELVPDVNHYTITMGKPGAAIVADRIRDLVG
ncbi:MAG TPA: alpha/beta hydrolase, partial [Egibacteraceae bacterium]|nr:alpha/beta hydrolase [Egibacteraceae bacterium]